MYPPSLLWWLGGFAILAGILGLVGMLAWWIDHRYQRHIEKHHGAPGDEQSGATALRLVFEALSAVLVVTSLLVAIYSDSPLLRGVAGVALVVVVASATFLLISRFSPDD